MKKNYNFKRRKLILPEYGRHVQEMVDSLLEIRDKRVRTRQAKALIAIMGDMNPTLRDTADFHHKLWDHLYIMSDFKLDVDSPYARPTQQELTGKPSPMRYPQRFIRYRHYGRYVPLMLERLKGCRDKARVDETVRNLMCYMRASSYEYNRKHPDNNIIVKDIHKMTSDAIVLDDNALKNLKSNYRQPFSARLQNAATADLLPLMEPSGQSSQNGGRNRKKNNNGGGNRKKNNNNRKWQQGQQTAQEGNAQSSQQQNNRRRNNNNNNGSRGNGQQRRQNNNAGVANVNANGSSSPRQQNWQRGKTWHNNNRNNASSSSGGQQQGQRRQQNRQQRNRQQGDTRQR